VNILIFKRSPIWINCFTVFGILLLISFWIPEMSEDPISGRIRISIFACVLMAIVAVLSYWFKSVSPKWAYTSNVLWIFSFILFLYHAYLTIFVYFGGITEAIEGQGKFIGTSNIILTIWWIIDVFLLVSIGLENRGIRLQHGALMIAVIGAFLFTVLRRSGFSYIFGVLVLLVFLAALYTLIRVSRKPLPATIPR